MYPLDFRGALEYSIIEKLRLRIIHVKFQKEIWLSISHDTHIQGDIRKKRSISILRPCVSQAVWGRASMPCQRAWASLFYAICGFNSTGLRAGIYSPLSPISLISLSLSTYIIYKLIKKRVRVCGFKCLWYSTWGYKGKTDVALMWQ